MDKLLILGATASEISLIRRARSYGYYVIVTDSHTDWSLSPAKFEADEAWNISWSDLDTLERLCREHEVGGVTAGYSEFRVENLIKLCERLHFPCYITEEQLEITRDKIKFKDACRKYGVPTVKEYDTPQQVDRFPVIVKPVDRGGSIGISIATDPLSLEKAYAYAMEQSVRKQVIIEEYVHDQVKVDFYYGVEDGEIELLSSCDTINAKNNGFERVVQSAWLYPMHQQADMASADQHMRRMICGMGIRYGCIIFSGFVDKEGHFSAFECGFRMEGAHQYGYVARRGLMNFLDIFILHAMTGHTRDLVRTAPFNPRMKCVIINLYAKRGTVTKIQGMSEIETMKDCTLALTQTHIGAKCEETTAILSKVGTFGFSSESPKQLRKDVEQAYALFSVTDENGNDMLYDRIDTSLIESWWE